MCLLQLYLVTMETFVVQRSRRSSPSMVYTTLENTLDQQGIEDISTCSSSKFLMIRTDKLTSMSRLTKSMAEDAKPKPYVDFFAKKRVVQPF